MTVLLVESNEPVRVTVCPGATVGVLSVAGIPSANDVDIGAVEGCVGLLASVVNMPFIVVARPARSFTSVVRYFCPGAQGL